ncbi:MAG: TonB-dependent receptor, partial [Burkholderiaceae bacterium]
MKYARRPRHGLFLGSAACVLMLSAAVLAQSDSVGATGSRQLPPVVVTGTPIDALGFDIPASIDRLEGEDLRAGRAQVNISEGLGGVTGLLARDRQNYAQDVQISVRGFGARSTFGLRGVRLYVDGIPATLPDGQGQLSHVELGTVGRIEVLRGPFSALYGNSSGGVIQVFTEQGSGAPRLRLDAAAGSYGMQRLGVQASGESGGIGYVVGASRFLTDGFRDHSAAGRTLGNAKLTLQPDPDRKLSLIVNGLSLSRAQDPLGLSRARFEVNPRAVEAPALVFDTRKSVQQTQAGLVHELRLDHANTLALTTYAGHRDTTQFQSIPVAPQTSPMHPGGVIVLGRDYSGVDVRWNVKARLLDGPLTIAAGLSRDALAEHRQGFQNFTGPAASPVPGVQGALRRDENNDVSNTDQYIQASWQPTPRWTVNAGVRHSHVRFTSTDAYIVGPNPDDSGAVAYGATLPVLGVLYALSREVHLYAAAGRGFETPTLNELAYRPGGGTGLNLALRASRSASVEVGLKTRSSDWGEARAAVFQTGTQHEIVTQTNVGGRTTFQNAGATRRTGLELGWTNYFLEHLRTQIAYTALQATYRGAFATCTVTPCAVPNQFVPAGKRIPGLARSSFFAALNWAPPSGWQAGAELRYLGKVFVNDANSDAAAAYAVASAHLG